MSQIKTVFIYCTLFYTNICTYMIRHETVRVFNALISADYIMDIIPTLILIEKRKNPTDQKSRGIRIIQYIININSIKYLHSFSELSFHVHTPYFLF